MSDLISGMTGERIGPVDNRRPTATAHPGLAGGSGGPVPPPPPPRPKFQATLSPYLADQYRQRPDWHAVLLRVSEAAREAWAALDREVEALQEVLDGLDELPAAQQAEAREAERQASEALAAGRAVKPAKATDWAGRKVALEAEARARLERCRTARAAYADVVQAELAPSLERLAAELEPMRLRALGAWQQAEQPLRAWRAAVSAADLIAERLRDGNDPSAITSEEQRRVRAQGVAGIGAVAALLDSADPVVSGRRHTEPGPLAVPAWTREAWARGAESDIARLAELEAGEDYKITNYTERQFAHLLPRGE